MRTTICRDTSELTLTTNKNLCQEIGNRKHTALLLQVLGQRRCCPGIQPQRASPSLRTRRSGANTAIGTRQEHAHLEEILRSPGGTHRVKTAGMAKQTSNEVHVALRPKKSPQGYTRAVVDVEHSDSVRVGFYIHVDQLLVDCRPSLCSHLFKSMWSRISHVN